MGNSKAPFGLRFAVQQAGLDGPEINMVSPDSHREWAKTHPT